MKKNNKNKCSFCMYFTGRSCMVTPNSYYCTKAIEQYKDSLKEAEVKPVKSLRSWDKR